MLLEPQRIWQRALEIDTLRGHLGGIRPANQPGIGQALPGEQRPRIDLALRSDVAVTDDAVDRQVVALDQILEQGDQRIDLRFAVRLPDGTVRPLFIALIDQLDTDAAGIQPGAPLPGAIPGVPGTAILVDQAVDGGRAIADQVVTAHLALGQQSQGMGQVGGGVVHHDVLHATALAARAEAVVNNLSAGAGGQQQGGESKQNKAHRIQHRQGIRVGSLTRRRAHGCRVRGRYVTRFAGCPAACRR